MRAILLLTILVGVFVSSQGLDLSSLKDAGMQALDKVVSAGKDLLKNTLDSFLQDLVSKFGKRDLSLATNLLKGLAGKVASLVESGKETAKKLFSGALDKLKELSGRFQKAIGTAESAEDFANEVNAVVEEHSTNQKRFVSDLIQKGKDLISGLVGKVKEKASELVSSLLQKGADILGKRSTLSDSLKSAGNFLSSVVANVGSTLKGHFTNLVDTVKGHANALKDKLAPHIDDLKGHGQRLLEHGKNAVSALAETVKDVLKQTLDNVGPTIKDASKTALNAGKTVVGHFTGSDDAKSE